MQNVTQNEDFIENLMKIFRKNHCVKKDGSEDNFVKKSLKNIDFCDISHQHELTLPECWQKLNKELTTLFEECEKKEITTLKKADISEKFLDFLSKKMKLSFDIANKSPETFVVLYKIVARYKKNTGDSNTIGGRTPQR